MYCRLMEGSIIHAMKFGHLARGLGFIVLISGRLSFAEEQANAPQPETFYTSPAVFSTRPSSQSVLVQSVDRFGPVGLGIELHPPAFVMKIKSIEEGSPAATTGKLKAGQIIETINGEKLHDIDPRIQLGNIITTAEATDGKVVIAVKDDEKAPEVRVTVEIPVLGAYSDTWPLDCPKSDKIVRNLADQLAREGHSGKVELDGPKILFMLSTGEEKDLEVVRGWMKTLVEKNANYGEGSSVYAWFTGWGGPPIAEYYLRTGDKSVLPLMKKIADALRKTMYHDGWGGRGMPGHHMGLAGTSTLEFLLLARQCGVEVEEGMLQAALQHYFRFAGKGVNPYMDAHPEQTLTDNGRNAMLAYAMAAASALLPDDKNDIYEWARDIAAMHSFYSASYMLHGHTGGGIGEVWRSAAMGLMYDRKPRQYRDFMKERTWWYDLSRRYDGSFGVLGGEGYDKTSWGITMGLTYTAPRKKLCIFGAPRSKFAEYYKIPERPWGTAADDDFLKLDAAADKDGKIRDLDHETVVADSGLAFNGKLEKAKLSDAEVMELARHPQHMYRARAADIIYKEKRYSLIPELLKDNDARVRYAGVSVMKMPTVSSRPEKCDPGFPMEAMTYEVVSLLGGMLNDPKESWFILDQVVRIMGRRTAVQLAPHADRIAGLIGHEEQWISHAALGAIVPLAVDKQYYRQVLPAIEKHVPNFLRAPGELGKLAERLADADPEVQKAGLEAISRVYLAYPGTNTNPPGGRHPASDTWYLDAVAGAISSIPGGLEKLYDISKKRFPNTALTHRSSFMNAEKLDSSGDDIQKAVAKAIMDELVPELVAKNYDTLCKLAKSEKIERGGCTGGRADPMQQLAELYAKAGDKAYGWEAFGPERHGNEWDYITFDPPEKGPNWADERKARYRKVTYPEGMEKWFGTDFDPQAAGWKKGKAPFANFDGKLPEAGACSNSVCGCGDAGQTLWDKEVLLIRRTFDLPPLKDGYRYRLLVGGSSHVGVGDGFCVYINGRNIAERSGYGGRGSGGEPDGAAISADLFDEFKGGKVVVAATSFLRQQHRLHKIQGHINIWFQQQKIPPMNEDMVRKSATLVPMSCAAWQELQNPGVEIDPDEGKFRYDGKFVLNKVIPGDWTVIGQVASMAAFDPEKGPEPLPKGNTLFTAMSLKDNGQTGNPFWIWSGSTLMDLKRCQALAMTQQTMKNADYLFVETGGFDAKNGPEWKCPLLVMKRK